MRSYDAFEPVADPAVITAPLAEWFGIPPETFSGHRFWKRPSARAIWVADRGLTPPPGLRPEAFGMLVSRMKSRTFKPSSVFIQRFGGAATRNTCRLTGAQLERLLAREPVPLEGTGATDGLVILRDEGDHPIGVGLLRGGVLETQLPKAWTLPAPG